MFFFYKRKQQPEVKIELKKIRAIKWFAVVGRPFDCVGSVGNGREMRSDGWLHPKFEFWTLLNQSPVKCWPHWRTFPLNLHLKMSFYHSAQSIRLLIDSLQRPTSIQKWCFPLFIIFVAQISVDLSHFIEKLAPLNAADKRNCIELRWSWKHPDAGPETWPTDKYQPPSI